MIMSFHWSITVICQRIPTKYDLEFSVKASHIHFRILTCHWRVIYISYGYNNIFYIYIFKKYKTLISVLIYMLRADALASRSRILNYTNMTLFTIFHNGLQSYLGIIF